MLPLRMLMGPLIEILILLGKDEVLEEVGQMDSVHRRISASGSFLL
jgi:hypothetical protein